MIPADKKKPQTLFTTEVPGDKEKRQNKGPQVRQFANPDPNPVAFLMPVLAGTMKKDTSAARVKEIFTERLIR